MANKRVQAFKRFKMRDPKIWMSGSQSGKGVHPELKGLMAASEKVGDFLGAVHTGRTLQGARRFHESVRRNTKRDGDWIEGHPKGHDIGPVPNRAERKKAADTLRTQKRSFKATIKTPLGRSALAGRMLDDRALEKTGFVKKGDTSRLNRWVRAWMTRRKKFGKKGRR